MALKRLVDLSQTTTPLELTEMQVPEPGDDDILIRISACGVCHTELDEIEGRTPPPRLPVIPGHQAVGYVVCGGERATRFSAGERVGVAWIYWACGTCRHCRQGNENLCAQFQATGRDRHGGYAQYMVIDQRFAHPIPAALTDFQAAPLLCAGAIGFRSLRLTGLKNGMRLGLTGFGASAHLVLKMVQHLFPDSRVYVFARNPREQGFARRLGAVWAGDTMERAPKELHAVIDTTPAWIPVIAALENLAPGGRLVINAIRKESRDQAELANIDYARHVWMEKEIKSVANVARQDVAEFLELAGRIPILPEVQTYALEDANKALVELKQRSIRGAKVLMIAS